MSDRTRRVATRMTAASTCAALLAVLSVGSVSAAATPSPSPSQSQTQSPAQNQPPTLAPAASLAALNPSAPVPTASEVSAAITGFLNQAVLGGSVVGEVVDAVHGDVLWSANPTNAVAPASVTKLLTAAAALITLGPADRPVTELVTDGPVVDGVLDGDLVLRGGGDVLLSADPTTAWPARAGVDQLAAALRAAGVARVQGRLVADGSLFTGSMTAPSWDPSYVTGGSIAPVTALGVDEAGSAVGRGNRSADPRRAAATALRAALTRAGITVTGQIVTGQAPAGARTLVSVPGTPVLAEVEEMLQNSDNDMAESLGRRIALKQGRPATFADAGAAVKASLEQLGVPVAGLTLVDASGLSHDDRVASATVAALLRLAATPAEAGGKTVLRPVLDGLAVGAFDGTLAPRFQLGSSIPGGGLVRAKTGALSGVSSLAGSVVDTHGRQLLFVWISDAVRSRPLAENALDAAAAALAGL